MEGLGPDIPLFHSKHFIEENAELNLPTKNTLEKIQYVEFYWCVIFFELLKR